MIAGISEASLFVSATYIQIQRNIISSDSTLRRNLNGNLLQALNVLNFIDDRSQYCQARVQNAMEFAHSLNDPCLLLRDEPI